MISPLAIDSNNNYSSTIPRNLQIPGNSLLKNSPYIPRRKRIILPNQQRYFEAKRKYEIRKSLLTSLDMDIHKVTLILRNFHSKDIPNIVTYNEKRLTKNLSLDHTI